MTTTADLHRLDPGRAARVAQLEAYYAKTGIIVAAPRNKPREKPVIVNGVRYESSHKAALAVGFCEGYIRDVARGQFKTDKFTARWAE